ncbi:acyl-CoA binding protein [Novymonas esmeraldas]|uniref:Acyl-CoA binding protein n=1 Tax=Novymonas esmeraldas TaxID=1808958 RepID=A0AAW0EVD2_9TRYP
MGHREPTGGVSHPHPEFTVLRRPAGEADRHWYTATHLGTPVSFRVLDDDGVTAVDGTAYMQARVQRMQKQVQEVRVSAAAQLAYQAVLVEVSLLDDPVAVPDEVQREMDCAVDLWSPLHVALMTANISAALALLQFHVEHAVEAMACVVASTASGAAGLSVDNLAPSGNSRPASASPTAATSILECQVRRELGGAVVLLGCLDKRARLAAATACKSHPQSPVTHGSPPPPPVPVNNSTGDDDADAAVVLQHVRHDSEALLAEEDALFENMGESYCLCNILTALQALLQSVVFEVEQRGHGATQESAIDFVHDYCSSLSMQPQHPPLLMDGDAVFQLCRHGDVALLAKVMDVFEGCLAPILRGQTLVADRGGAPPSVVASLASPHPPSPNPSPSLTSAAPVALPGLASLSRDVGTPRGGSTSRHPHSSPPSPFWWSCPPQQVHHVAFIAVWTGLREAAEESSGSGRRRRAVSLSNESRLMMTTVRQLHESRVAAQKLDSSIWSGHLSTITKLLSRECSVEDYMDFVDEGGSLAVTAPRGFTGLFLSALVSGVMAAALVREPTALRMLRRKVETLLADVPGRPSPLRLYVMGRPSTHAERFRELWIDAACSPDGGSSHDAGVRGGRRPMKFRTRVELLYYAVVEEVVAAAEEAWAAPDDDVAITTTTTTTTAGGQSAAGTMSSPWSPSGATRAEAQKALLGWLRLWINFLASLRERTPHRRSLSYSSASSQVPVPHSLNSSTDGPLAVGGRASSQAAATLPAGSLAPHHQPSSSAEDLFSDDANESTEVVQRLCSAVVERLGSGQAPLPSLRGTLFPSGVNDVDAGAAAAGASSVQVDAALPVSSIDQEFASAQHAFAAMAAKESNEVKLKFYGLFKQATVGDVNTDRPGIFDYAGKAKWDAWSKLKGMSLLDAKRMYVSEYKMMVELRKSHK